MRRLLVWPVLAVSSSIALAQDPGTPPRPLPPAKPLTPPQGPSEPQKLPPSVAPMAPSTSLSPQPNRLVTLPRAENLQRIESAVASVRATRDGYQLWSGVTLFRDFGRDKAAAEEARRIIRDLRSTEWGLIGSGVRPVVEYGLTDGKPATWSLNPQAAVPLDLDSLRAEQVRGAWVVRDEQNIVLNFGVSRQEAEQAVAVALKYGFNHLGFVGEMAAPKMAFFYAAKVSGEPNRSGAGLAQVAQEQGLSRTGIPVPGVGYVGEQVKIDFRRVEVRKERGEFVLAHGTEILAKFGPNDWTARDALKVVQECRFTEFCKVGASDVSFFLVNGSAPTRVPFMAQGSRFNPTTLKARPVDSRWGVFESTGRMLFTAPTASEADQLIQLVQAYQFDQVCQVGLSTRASMKFLAKVGR